MTTSKSAFEYSWGNALGRSRISAVCVGLNTYTPGCPVATCEAHLNVLQRFQGALNLNLKKQAA